jgi:putative FmdB family regulatory protein
MPIYEYQCNRCGHRFELLPKTNNSDIEISCPKCHAEQPKRLLSMFGSSASKDVCGGTPVASDNSTSERPETEQQIEKAHKNGKIAAIRERRRFPMWGIALMILAVSGISIAVYAYEGRFHPSRALSP